MASMGRLLRVYAQAQKRAEAEAEAAKAQAFEAALAVHLRFRYKVEGSCPPHCTKGAVARRSAP